MYGDYQSTDASPETEQPETPEDVVAYCDKLFEEAASYRKRFEPDWKEAERQYHGIHWENDVGRRPFVNMIFKTIEEETPILTDSKPGTSVVAIEDMRIDEARVLEEAIDYVYKYNQFDLKLPQAVRTMLIVGTGYLYYDWNPELENGDGQVVIRNMPWRYVYLDPNQGDIDLMSHIHIRYPERVETIKRMFSETEGIDRIEPEDIEIDDSSEYSLYQVEDRYNSPKSSTRSMGEYKPVDMAYLHECYYKDYTMEPIPDEDTQAELEMEWSAVSQGLPVEVSKYQDHQKIISFLQQQKISVIGEAAGQADAAMMPDISPDAAVLSQLIDDLISQHQVMSEENPTGMRPKYPNNIRLVIKVGKVLLYDGPAPVNDGLYPLVPFYCYKIENMPYGISEVKNILPIQKCIDELNYSWHKALRLTSNPGWVKDDKSLVDDETLTNEEGIVITKAMGTEVRRLEPGQVSPQIQGKILQDINYIDDITGMHESLEGKRPSGVTAARAIEALRDSSLSRIRLKTRGIESSMERSGELTASRIIKYWKKQRMLKNYDQSGQIQTLEFDPDRLQDLNYIVRITPGSTLGMSKEFILQMSQELLQAGAIDFETFVTMNDLPYKDLLLSKIQEQKVQQAQALASQAMALSAANEPSQQGMPAEQPGPGTAAVMPIRAVKQ